MVYGGLCQGGVGGHRRVLLVCGLPQGGGGVPGWFLWNSAEVGVWQPSPPPPVGVGRMLGFRVPLQACAMLVSCALHRWLGGWVCEVKRPPPPWGGTPPGPGCSKILLAGVSQPPPPPLPLWLGKTLGHAHGYTMHAQGIEREHRGYALVMHRAYPGHEAYMACMGHAQGIPRAASGVPAHTQGKYGAYTRHTDATRKHAQGAGHTVHAQLQSRGFPARKHNANAPIQAVSLASFVAFISPASCPAASCTRRR